MDYQILFSLYIYFLTFIIGFFVLAFISAFTLFIIRFFKSLK